MRQPFALATLLAASLAAAAPELIVHNALVWTANPDAPAATAFAIQDGRFTSIGADAPTLALADSATRILDARGARIVPGLIDAHLHLANAARTMEALDLRPAASRDDLLRLVRETAATLPPDAWLLARGWSAESWPDQRLPPPAEYHPAPRARRALLTPIDR
ncbi:MAG: amidohydrolase family protein, partial [Phycisphaerales bacterium]|nr:amidohydrolase family protein [Phycisphaerales bacterium]